MTTVFRNNVKGFNLELTNICTLKCLACPRTEMINLFPKAWKNHNMNFSNLKNFLDIDIKDLEFSLCGSYGDPIYYPNLIPVCKWLKSKGARIMIVTNGSYQKNTFWEEITSVLTDSDEIVWSIDGIPENFKTYRVNADWESIKSGIDIITRTNIKTTWKYIVFNYNENTIDKAKELSSELGIQQFFVSKSDRWGEIAEMKPSENFVGYRDKTKEEYRSGNRDIQINPECANGTTHYISADGYYIPCSYISVHKFYYKTPWGNSKTRERFNIAKTTFTQIQEDAITIDFDKSIIENPCNACKFQCPKQNV